MIWVELAGWSDVGRQREVNEDRLFYQVHQSSDALPVAMCIVADGVGGHLGGRVASHWAVETIKRELATLFFPTDPRATQQLISSQILALSGCPLVPYHIEADRQWVARSWDAHKLAKPFSSVYITIGAPYYVDREQLREHEQDMLAEFQARMMENTAHCERLAGG